MAFNSEKKGPRLSRRKFLSRSSHVATGAAFLPFFEPAGVEASPLADKGERVSLDGVWKFRLDPDSSGEKNRWFAAVNCPLFTRESYYCICNRNLL
jgi:hypothetical protein